jgi:hypothetical protein
MAHATIVRYEVKPESANENERLVQDVYAELAETRPAGFHYATFRLDDGVTFIHVATIEGENPLTSSAAFAAFQAGLGARCTVSPNPSRATVVGSYGIGIE